MAMNIEIKARVKDVRVMQERIEEITGKRSTILRQEDTFFHVPNGRLKLRMENDREGQLIYYYRPDMAGPKESDYEIVKVADAEGLQKVLSAALGVRGIVKKKRKLYKTGTTRIHLDHVAGLGYFLELEVVQTKRRVKQDPETLAEELVRKLGILQEDLVEGAYIDHLERVR